MDDNEELVASLAWALLEAAPYISTCNRSGVRVAFNKDPLHHLARVTGSVA